MEAVQLLRQRSSGKIAQAERGETIHQVSDEASLVRVICQIPFLKDKERFAGREIQIPTPSRHVLHQNPRGFPLLAAEQREARLLEVVGWIQHLEQPLVEEIPDRQEAEPDREQIVRSRRLLVGVEITFDCDKPRRAKIVILITMSYSDIDQFDLF